MAYSGISMYPYGLINLSLIMPCCEGNWKWENENAMKISHDKDIQRKYREKEDWENFPQITQIKNKRIERISMHT
jgi:hypothetical protein